MPGTRPALTDDQLTRLLAPPTGPVEVVIDTDVTNEVDDQFAIAWALLRPERLTVRALHACPYALGPHVLTDPGFVTEPEKVQLADVAVRAAGIPVVSAAEGVERAADECRILLALAGRTDIPVVDGSCSFLPDVRTPVASDSVDSLIALAHEDREGPLYVLAIGCATNVASALLVDPSIAERVVVVWTSGYPSFWPYRNTSFNLAQDIASARVLLDSGVPHVYLPGYYVGEQLRISSAELDAHVRGRGPLGDHLADVCAASSWFDRPGSSKVIWDLVNVAWALEPSWLPSGLVATPVLDEQLVWRQQPGRHLMREAHSVQRDAIWLDLYAALDEHAAATR